MGETAAEEGMLKRKVGVVEMAADERMLEIEIGELEMGEDAGIDDAKTDDVVARVEEIGTSERSVLYA